MAKAPSPDTYLGFTQGEGGEVCGGHRVTPSKTKKTCIWPTFFWEGPHFTKKKKLGAPLTPEALLAFDLASLLASWGSTGS